MECQSFQKLYSYIVTAHTIPLSLWNLWKVSRRISLETQACSPEHWRLNNTIQWHKKAVRTCICWYKMYRSNFLKVHILPVDEQKQCDIFHLGNEFYITSSNKINYFYFPLIVLCLDSQKCLKFKKVCFILKIKSAIKSCVLSLEIVEFVWFFY